jgi:cytidine deaminase
MKTINMIPDRDAPDRLLNAGLRRRLLTAARKASRRAYAPYSGFPVGAAALDEKGNMHVGCNVENASYGLATCAERNAVAAAVAAGARRLRVMLVYAPTPSLTPPCGACRQVLAELGDDAMLVCLANDRGDLAVFTLGDLLPHGFRFKPATRNA